MSEISKMTAQEANTQLPVNVYFDENVLALEKELIFKNSSIYLGNEKMIPEQGDWHTLAHEASGRAIVNTDKGIQLISNVCRHRQAIMLGGQYGDVTGQPLKGNLESTGGNIVCPLHRWTYNDTGKLIGAPHFEKQPDCHNLQTFTFKDCHGLLFEGPRNPAQDMQALFERPEFDFSQYVLGGIKLHECNYNWKTFIEVYLEDYHVDVFHPGLGNFVTCSDLSWEFSDWYSSQKVGVQRALANPGSPVYKKWHEELMRYNAGQEPDFGAIWVTYFPTHMIEIYPNVLVLSTLYPVSAQKTINQVEFYYPEEIAMFEPDFMKAQQAAYMETCDEDDEIAERMDAGRLALYKRGTSEVGPYQQPMEAGMEHFHQWYRRMMANSSIKL